MDSILTYINEEPIVAKKVLNQRKILLEDFTSNFVNSNISRIIIVGSGTSFHAGAAAKVFFERATGLEVTVEYPSIFLENAEFYKGNILVIGVSQSGSSTATIEALKKAKALGYSTLALTGGEHTTLEEYADSFILIPCGKEAAGPKTKGYLATVLLLYCLAIEIALASQKINYEKYSHIIKEMNILANNLSKVIKSSIQWCDRNKEDLMKVKKISVIGYEQNYPTALEGALKLVETIRCPAISYEFEEYLHGPYNAIDGESYIIIIKSPGKLEKRAEQLYELISEYTEHIYVITNEESRNKKWLNGCFCNIDYLIPLEYVIPFQVLCACIPPELGIDPFRPKFPDFHRTMGSKIY